MLEGKAAIVTGGSRGIGRAIALTFARSGASVVLVAEDQDTLELVAGEIREAGQSVRVVAGDVALPETAGAALQASLESFQTVDILVNCAGTITRSSFEELSLEDWNRVLDVNLHGTFHMCRTVLPIMRAKRAGKIINISSQMAKLPHPSASPSYEVSKSGQLALTRHLAYHYAKYGICVNAIAPGSINTRMPQSMSVEAREALKKAIPLQRLGEPSEVGDCALFLASHMSNYITGETIDVNGGSLMD